MEIEREKSSGAEGVHRQNQRRAVRTRPDYKRTPVRPLGSSCPLAVHIDALSGRETGKIGQDTQKMQDASSSNNTKQSSATRRAKTRLVLVLGILTLLLSQMRAADDKPTQTGYVRPNRPSLFTIKRAIR